MTDTKISPSIHSIIYSLYCIDKNIILVRLLYIFFQLNAYIPVCALHKTIMYLRAPKFQNFKIPGSPSGRYSSDFGNPKIHLTSPNKKYFF